MIKQTYKKWIAACTVTSSLLLGACTSTPPSVRDVSIVPLPNNVQQDSSAFILPKSAPSASLIPGWLRLQNIWQEYFLLPPDIT